MVLYHWPNDAMVSMHRYGLSHSLPSTESGDPFNFLIRNAHPEESGWYWCVSGDFESGRHVAVVVPAPPTSPPTVPAPLPSFPPEMSTTEDSLQEPMGPLK